MSFGFSISDVLAISGLISDVVARVRAAAGEFEQFADDLGLAATLFQQLHGHFDTYTRHYNSLQPSQQKTIITVFEGIREGLTELQTTLVERHHSVGQTLHLRSNLRFTHALPQLRQRLEVHMRSISLLVQNVQFAQTSDIRAILERIEAAQQEDREISQGIEGENGRIEGSIIDTTTATSVREGFIADWRDEIDQWRKGVRSLQPSMTIDESETTTVTTPMENKGLSRAKRWALRHLAIQFALMVSNWALNIIIACDDTNGNLTTVVG